MQKQKRFSNLAMFQGTFVFSGDMPESEDSAPRFPVKNHMLLLLLLLLLLLFHPVFFFVVVVSKTQVCFFGSLLFVVGIYMFHHFPTC